MVEDTGECRGEGGEIHRPRRNISPTRCIIHRAGSLPPHPAPQPPTVPPASARAARRGPPSPRTPSQRRLEACPPRGCVRCGPQHAHSNGIMMCAPPSRSTTTSPPPPAGNAPLRLFPQTGRPSFPAPGSDLLRQAPRETFRGDASKTWPARRPPLRQRRRAAGDPKAETALVIILDAHILLVRL